jgi:IS30 family transposase
MGAKHITAQEKELFQVLVNTGLSMQKVAVLTGRDAGTVSNHVTSTVSNHLTSSDTKPVGNMHLTQDEMFSMLDLHAQEMTCTQIAKEVGKAHGTVYKVINHLYPKHQKAYAKWLELQKQEEESPALVMEFQTVEAQKQDEPEQPGIDWQAKWCDAQQQIAELREINSILKGYVRHLQRLNEQ